MATNEPYALDVTLGTGKKDLQLTVPTNGIVQISLVKLSSDAPSTAAIQITPIRSDREPAIPVTLDPTNLTFQSNAVFASATLHVPPLRPFAKYTGTLALTAPGVPPIFWPVTLNSPEADRPATLLVLPGSRKISITDDWLIASLRWIWGLISTGPESPQMTVVLKDKTGRWPLEGIGVTPGMITAPDRANFDLAKNVTFFLDGNKIPGFSSSTPGVTNLQLRSTPAGGVGVLGLSFNCLKAGQYTVELNFFALNSQDDAQQKLTLTVTTGHSLWLVGIWLAMSMLISFVAYKILRPYKEKLDLRGRIDTLRPGWLFYRDPVYSVVWVRTVLKQALVLTRRIWLVPSVIGERLDKVAPVLDALNQAGQADEQLAALPKLARKRFKAIIAGHVRTISDHNMDKAVADKARDALATLNGELPGRKWQTRYCAEVEKAIKAFLMDFPEDALGGLAKQYELDAKQEDKLKVMRADLQKGLSALPADVEKVMKLEQTYAKLKLLVERKNYREEFKQLFKHLDDSDLDQIFFIADKEAWLRVKSAEGSKKLSIVAPKADEPEPLEAFRPLKFYITTGDERLDNTYLFNSGLRFHWTCKLLEQRKKRILAPGAKGEPKLLSETKPETHSPRVAQFAPDAGKWVIEAKIECHLEEPGKGQFQEQAQAQSIEVNISKSSDIGYLRSIDRLEAATSLIAFVFALITGIATFYYKNPTFGSVQDYLGLFLWGAAIDQTKNFLKDIQGSK